MIEWNRVSATNKPPEDKMCLIAEPGGRVTQAHYGNEIFSAPWGQPYPEKGQPEWWAELNYPINDKS